MEKIAAIKVLDGYRIWMKFQDGLEKELSFLQFLGKGISKQLLDPAYFSQARIESGGGLAWPNGFDFCPNFLREIN